MVKFIFSQLYNTNLKAKKRAYLALYHANDFAKIRVIRARFGKVRFPQIKGTVSFDLELATRQYYLNLFGGLRLESQILLALGKKRSIRFYPLHRLYIPILRENGIKVSFFWTQTSFFVIMFCLWARGFYRLLIFSFKPSGLSQVDTQSECFSFFDKLSIKNLPDFYPDGSSYDVITWYINKFKPTEKKIFHNVKNINSVVYKGYKISASNGPLPIPDDYFRFLLSSLGILTRTLVDLFSGKWWKAMLVNEFIEANRFDYCNQKLIASDYFFYNSMTFYRPIWTYKAEEKGSSIVSYFYSTSETIMAPEGVEDNSDYRDLMNWPQVWVWDDFQKKLFENSFINTKKIKVVGPIHFGGVAIEIKKSSLLKVAIFDSPPFKLGSYFGFSTSNGLGLNEPKIHIDFINHIVEAFDDFNVQFYFKPKRVRNKKYEVKSYIKALNEIQIKNNFQILNGDISAGYLIKISDVVASFPFTSTGVIGKDQKKKTFYYDPTGMVSNNDKASHGIPLFSNINDLKLWVKKDYLFMKFKQT